MTTHDEMDRSISDGDQLNDGYFNALATLVPVGGVIAWLKTFTNTPALPDGWVECDGSAISDATSVYNGQNTPDLNGDAQFLRGNSSSGGTGGAATTTGQNVQSGSGAETPVQAANNNIPPYYDVVWIMRIK